MKERLIKLGVVLGVLLLTAMALTGQTMFMDDGGTEVPELEFRFMRPFWESDDSLGFLSGIYDLTFSQPFKGKKSRLNWVVSIPFSYMHVSGDSYSESESGIGNLYLGVQQRLKPGTNKGVTGSFGAFIPLASEDDYFAHFLGFLSDPYRNYKYMPNTLTLRANLAYQFNGAKAFFKAELGPDVMIPTKYKYRELEIMVHYGIGGGLYLGDFILSGELIGYGIITEDIDDFEDRFVNYINFGVTWKKGRIRPGIFYMLPLDKDMGDFLDGAIGIKVEVDLKK